MVSKQTSSACRPHRRLLVHIHDSACLFARVERGVCLFVAPVLPNRVILQYPAPVVVVLLRGGGYMGTWLLLANEHSG